MVISLYIDTCDRIDVFTLKEGISRVIEKQCNFQIFYNIQAITVSITSDSFVDVSLLLHLVISML